MLTKLLRNEYCIINLDVIFGVKCGHCWWDCILRLRAVDMNYLTMWSHGWVEGLGNGEEHRPCDDAIYRQCERNINVYER